MRSKTSGLPDLPALFFVYGTLKRGHGNNRVLADSEFVGSARTVKTYALKIQGLPFLLDQRSEFQVHGEVYQVTTTDIAERLDRLEGHPDFYKRQLIDAELPGGQVKKCWAYFLNTDSRHLQSLPNHSTYAGRS